MEGQPYKRQVALLLNVLPEVAKETCFALHGGTAINLFVRNMPRLSIDIDLTYIPIENRADTLLNITQALERVKSNIERVIPDVKYLLKNEGFTAVIKKGFLLSLLSSNRPINEMLYPNFLDQQLVMTNQFEGMSNELFNNQDFEETREALVDIIHKNLTDRDKEFLLSFKNLKPDWSIYDFEKFPAVQWKLQNLQKLKDNNSVKYKALFKILKEKFSK